MVQHHFSVRVLITAIASASQSQSPPGEEAAPRNIVTVNSRQGLIQAVKDARPGLTVRIAPGTYRFAENHWFCIDAPERSDRLRLPVAETNGRYGQSPEFVDVEKHDLRLRSTSPVRNAGARPVTEGG